MRSKLIAALGILLTATLGFSGLAPAERITDNSYEDSFPNVKGNYLVWQGRVGGDWEIFLYDISDSEAEPIRITHNSYDDISPQTDGNYVVWLGYNRTGGEIFVYHIGDPIPITSGENAITNDTNIDCSPQIANGRVVWTSHQVGNSVEPGEIILYEIGTPTPSTLSASVDPDGTLDDSSPRINDTEVMWVQADGSGHTAVFIYNLTIENAEPEPAPAGYVWPNSPQSDGSLSVLARHDGHDREIFVHDSDSRRYHQVTYNDLQDRYPRISGNKIAWVAGEGKMREIYLAFYGEDTSTGDGGGGGETDTSTGDGGGGGGPCFIATAAFTW